MALETAVQGLLSLSSLPEDFRVTVSFGRAHDHKCELARLLEVYKEMRRAASGIEGCNSAGSAGKRPPLGSLARLTQLSHIFTQRSEAIAEFALGHCYLADLYAWIGRMSGVLARPLPSGVNCRA